MSSPVTKADLVDALGCFWNAAIGESHRQQEAMSFAAIMATGIAAVAQRLEELDVAVEPSAQYAAGVEAGLAAAETFLKNESAQWAKTNGYLAGVPAAQAAMTLASAVDLMRTTWGAKAMRDEALAKNGGAK